MNELTNKINDILTKWDPIGVGEEMAMDEYKEYIPMIIHYAQDRQKLINHLEKMLVDYMGLSYDQYSISIPKLAFTNLRTKMTYFIECITRK